MSTQPQSKPNESDRAPVTLPRIAEMKANGEPIVMVTAYDYPSGLVAEEAGVDIVLVGDTAAMVVLGYDATTPVGMDEMVTMAASGRDRRRAHAAYPHPGHRDRRRHLHGRPGSGVPRSAGHDSQPRAQVRQALRGDPRPDGRRRPRVRRGRAVAEIPGCGPRLRGRPGRGRGAPGLPRPGKPRHVALGLVAGAVRG